MSETIPFRPSNGMHSWIFSECFCFRCKRDQKFQETQEAEDGCPIVAAAFVYDTNDPRYPKEWIQDADSDPGMIGAPGARCTAFDPIDP